VDDPVVDDHGGEGLPFAPGEQDRLDEVDDARSTARARGRVGHPRRAGRAARPATHSGTGSPAAMARQHADT
jgi:hypothetical protein